MAITENVTIAAMSASIIIRAASRRALSVTNGPGSFMPVFLDSLFHLKREYLYQIQLQDKYMNIKEQLVT
jgi:hydroxyethylthiazole kinase-like sugar kinase family protein